MTAALCREHEWSSESLNIFYSAEAGFVKFGCAKAA